MLTALLILAVVVLVAGLVGMFSLAMKGDFFAWVWLASGGAGDLLELIAKVLAAIADANR